MKASHSKAYNKSFRPPSAVVNFHEKLWLGGTKKFVRRVLSLTFIKNLGSAEPKKSKLNTLSCWDASLVGVLFVYEMGDVVSKNGKLLGDFMTGENYFQSLWSVGKKLVNLCMGYHI